MFKGCSTNTLFDLSIVDEESAAQMRIWLEPIDCDTIKLGMELGSDTEVSGKIMYGLVSQKELLNLHKEIKDDSEAAAIGILLTVESYDMETDKVEQVDEQALIPLKGRFSMREFLVQYIPIAVSVMKLLPKLTKDDELAVTMTTPRGSLPS